MSSIPSPSIAQASTVYPRPMTQLLDQSPEVLHNIFGNVEPADLGSVARTCRFLNSFIQNDELLWKLHYLSLFVGSPCH